MQYSLTALKTLSLGLLLLANGLSNKALQAQVKGQIVDENEEPLPGAAVVLLQNDTVKAGESTDANGRFSLSVAAGTYFLEVSFVGYQTKQEKVEISANNPLQLGNMSLRPSSQQLEEATVEAEAKMMEFSQDKRIFNVGKDLTNTASNASDILNNLPSVNVGVEGEVSLRGSQNVRILVNGKPSGLIGSDPASALRNLQSNMIERIEVITNPSARYDAEGEAGIINIVLKKQDKAGINGSFTVNGGYPRDYGAGASLNYRKNKLNLFTNLSFEWDRAPGKAYSKQQFWLEDTSYSFIRDRHQSRGGLNGDIRLGADYDLSEQETLTASLLFSPSKDNNRVNISYRDFNSEGAQVQTVTRFDDEIETERTLEGSLNWTRQYEDFKDHKWTADVQYTSEYERERSTIEQDTIGRPGTMIQKVDNLEEQRRILAQTDYVHPFDEEQSFETGARATLRTINNDYRLSNENNAGELIDDPRFTNQFTFIENVWAGYGIFNGAIGDNITYQTGLRLEYTDISTQMADVDTANRRTYLNLFPSLFFTYSISPLSDLQLSYSRRISRPGFWTLAPFFSFSDNRNFYSGNPDVNPEFTDSYDLGYLRYLESGSIYGGVYYRHRTGVVERISQVDSNGFTRIFPVNLSTQNAYGLEFNIQWEPTDWFSTNANINLYRAVTEGSYEGQDFNARTNTANGRISNTFTFWNSDLQLSFNLRAPEQTTQGRRLGIYTMDLAWSRDILKGKGTLTFAARDMFNTRYRRAYTYGENFSRFSRFQWRRGQFTLTFSYRLNKKNGPGQRRGKGGGNYGGGGGSR
jgi:outer membrane receptor protein involved in Fe transport